MKGSCIVASTVLPRMLDRLGVWSYGVLGSTTIEVPSRGIWRGLSRQDRIDFEGAELGHAWIVAPPFVVLDPTMSLQRWHGDEIAGYIPEVLAVDRGFKATRPRVNDIVAASIRHQFALREGREDSNLHHRLEPDLKRFGKTFPGLEVELEELRLRYIPQGVRVSDVPLEQINCLGDAGTSGREIWESIAPHFGLDR